MTDSTQGIASLPNELLYLVLNPLPAKTLLVLSTVSRRLHALVLRLLHHRLTIAAALDDHALILECYHPSAMASAGNLQCSHLGTNGLADALEHNGENPVGKIAHLGTLYTRFRAQRREHEKPAQRHPAGDVPGSRTHPSSNASSNMSNQQGDETELVGHMVNLDKHELFSQLCTVTYLARTGPRNSLTRSSFIRGVNEVNDGMIRIWRAWLAGQAELGGSPLVAGKGDGSAVRGDPAMDKSILWATNCNNAVGVKFRVRERKSPRDNSVLVAPGEEVAVSYTVEFEELLIRTTRLMEKLDESYRQEEAMSPKAVIFGPFVS